MRKMALGVALATLVGVPVARAIDYVPMQQVNTRMSGCNAASVSDGVLAWSADENEANRDMDHDKSLTGRVLVYVDTANGVVKNTKLPAGQNVALDHGLIAFALQHAGREQTLAFYAIKDTPWLKKGLLDTGIPAGWDTGRRNSLDQGRAVFQDPATAQVVLYDLATRTTRVLGNDAFNGSISGNTVVFAHYDPMVGQVFQIYDLATGTLTDTGVQGQYAVTDGSGFVFEEWPGLAYYDLQTQQTTHLAFGHFDDFGFGDGVIAMTAWEDDVWGDLNGDGVIGAYGGYLVLYDVKTGRLVNTGIQACCGGDVRGGLVAFDIYEGSDHTLVDLNGDGEINDCIMQYLDIRAWLGR